MIVLLSEGDRADRCAAFFALNNFLGLAADSSDADTVPLIQS
jgi:hypothetical protein